MIEIIQMIEQCQIHDTYTPVLAGIIARETAGTNNFVIGVNYKGKTIKHYNLKTKEEAVSVAKQLEKAGYNFDNGVAQINSNNVKKYGLTYNQIFDICNNIKMSANILYRNMIETNFDYIKALSMYNTGYANSPVGKEYAKAVLENIKVAKQIMAKIQKDQVVKEQTMLAENKTN